MSKMAQIKNDQDVIDDVDRALQRAEKLFDVEMWDQRRGTNIHSQFILLDFINFHRDAIL